MRQSLVSKPCPSSPRKRATNATAAPSLWGRRRWSAGCPAAAARTVRPVLLASTSILKRQRGGFRRPHGSALCVQASAPVRSISLVHTSDCRCATTVERTHLLLRTKANRGAGMKKEIALLDAATKKVARLPTPTTSRGTEHEIPASAPRKRMLPAQTPPPARKILLASRDTSGQPEDPQPARTTVDTPNGLLSPGGSAFRPLLRSQERIKAQMKQSNSPLPIWPFFRQQAGLPAFQVFSDPYSALYYNLCASGLGYPLPISHQVTDGTIYHQEK